MASRDGPWRPNGSLATYKFPLTKQYGSKLNIQIYHQTTLQRNITNLQHIDLLK